MIQEKSGTALKMKIMEKLCFKSFHIVVGLFRESQGRISKMKTSYRSIWT